MKYAKASAGSAKMVQVCRPKWYRVNAMASWAASVEAGSTPPRGGVAKCETGSATPQNMRIEPMPAANNMPNQVRVECSGSSSSAPSLTCPNRLRSEEHTSELQSRFDLVCRLLLE